MRDTGRNDDADVVSAAMIVAVHKKTHAPRRKTLAHVAQKHFGAALEKKHDVPLLAIVRTQRIILRFIDEQPPQPFFRGCVGGNARRMNVKTLGTVREHARSRPLSRRKFYFPKNPLPFAR